MDYCSGTNQNSYVYGLYRSSVDKDVDIHIGKGKYSNIYGVYDLSSSDCLLKKEI